MVAIIGMTLGSVWGGTPAAGAETTDLGSPAEVELMEIEVDQQWMVDDLRPSADALPYQPAGTLWEATATVELATGGVPVVAGFSARSDAQAYPVLWQVAAPLGVSPAPLPPNGSARGKLYFDVTGDPPDSVAYIVDGTDAAVWESGG